MLIYSTTSQNERRTYRKFKYILQEATSSVSTLSHQIIQKTIQEKEIFLLFLITCVVKLVKYDKLRS